MTKSRREVKRKINDRGCHHEPCWNAFRASRTVKPRWPFFSLISFSRLEHGNEEGSKVRYEQNFEMNQEEKGRLTYAPVYNS